MKYRGQHVYMKTVVCEDSRGIIREIGDTIYSKGRRLTVEVQAFTDSTHEKTESKRVRVYEDDVAPIEVWVNGYTITREYGGPEEGGWYYDCMNGYSAIECPSDMAPAIEAMMEQFMSKHEYGSLGSVNGGMRTVVMIERSRWESATTQTPRYK